jgi:ATP-dependent DNA helicase RecQ
MTAKLSAASRVLSDIWGYGDLRPLQRRAIVAVLSGRDVLAVLPTGGGKSLCYQIPALVLPGVTVVVSPLISLMQDQVAALRSRGVAASYLSSTQPGSERRAVLDALRGGRLRLLYLAPERCGTLAPLLRARAVSCLAVDEAHCISEWGHEFRPAYRTLGSFRRAVGNPPTIAVTATATVQTKADIVVQLGLVRPVEVIGPFDRPNLFFAACRVASDAERLRRLAHRLRGLDHTAVVYCPTRDRTDGVAALLRRWGFRALPYHAGLPGPARKGLLRRFLDGRVQVIVATSAFGMGIDKPDVRLVAHLGVPARPEAYVQEAGRAGRDGRPSLCVMYWTERDLELTRQLSLGESDEKSDHVRGTRAGIAAMRRYLTSRECRRHVLLSYLGDAPGPCAGCDRCSGSPESPVALRARG